MSEENDTFQYYADSSNPSSSSMSYQDSFLGLFREISKLQWVRESFSSHSKHYEGLQKRQKKEQNIKTSLLEKQQYVRYYYYYYYYYYYFKNIWN